MPAARQPAPAVAQPEQRVELLDQLRAAARPRSGPTLTALPGAGSGATSSIGIGDVEPAAQVDVAVRRRLSCDVARRLERLDQPVLQHERAELGVRRLVVDVLGLARPASRRGEVRPRARAQADRLADVERAAVGVAEDVDARVLRAAPEVGAPRARAGARPVAPRAAGAPRAGRSSATASPTVVRVRAQPREQRAEDARAGLGVRQRAVDAADLDPEPVGERGEPAPALRAARAGARARPCTAPAGRASRARRARTPGAARARRSARCGRRARGRAAARRARAAPPPAPARRRPSPG